MSYVFAHPLRDSRSSESAEPSRARERAVLSANTNDVVFYKAGIISNQQW